MPNISVVTVRPTRRGRRGLYICVVARMADGSPSTARQGRGTRPRLMVERHGHVGTLSALGHPHRALNLGSWLQAKTHWHPAQDHSMTHS